MRAMTTTPNEWWWRKLKPKKRWWWFQYYEILSSNTCVVVIIIIIIADISYNADTILYNKLNRKKKIATWKNIHTHTNAIWYWPTNWESLQNKKKLFFVLYLSLLFIIIIIILFFFFFVCVIGKLERWRKGWRHEYQKLVYRVCFEKKNKRHNNRWQFQWSIIIAIKQKKRRARIKLATSQSIEK